MTKRMEELRSKDIKNILNVGFKNKNHNDDVIENHRKSSVCSGNGLFISKFYLSKVVKKSSKSSSRQNLAFTGFPSYSSEVFYYQSLNIEAMLKS